LACIPKSTILANGAAWCGMVRDLLTTPLLHSVMEDHELRLHPSVGIVELACVVISVGCTMSLIAAMWLHAAKADGHLDVAWLVVLSPALFFALVLLCGLLAIPLALPSPQRLPTTLSASICFSALAVLAIGGQVISSGPASRWPLAFSPLLTLLFLRFVLALAGLRMVMLREGLAVALRETVPGVLRLGLAISSVVLLLCRLSGQAPALSVWLIASPWLAALALELMCGCMGCAAIGVPPRPPDACTDHGEWLMQRDRNACQRGFSAITGSLFQIGVLLTFITRLDGSGSSAGTWGAAYLPFIMLAGASLCCCAACAACLPQAPYPRYPDEAATPNSARRRLNGRGTDATRERAHRPLLASAMSRSDEP